MANKKLKNVVIINDFDYIQGGASKVAIQTANLLANEGLKVYFFSGHSIGNNDLNENVKRICTNQGEALKDSNKIRGCINGLYNFKAKKELKSLLLTLDKEETIIHVHGWTKCLSSSIFSVAFKLNYKITLTTHDYFTACPNGAYFNYCTNSICTLKPLSWRCIKCNCDSRNYAFKLYRLVRQFVQNKIVRLNDRIKYVISLSDLSEKILRKTLNKDVIIKRIYNPIEIDKNIKKVDINKNEYYLFLGRVSQEKNITEFCDAITKLDLKGLVVGDGNLLEELKEKYKKIEFVGWQSGENLKKYILKARTLIFPSKIYEVAPLTPFEVMQYGIPCIVSSCCAATEYINKNNGLIYNIEEENNLIKKIKYNEKNLQKYKVEIDEKYLRKYIDSLLDYYIEIL